MEAILVRVGIDQAYGGWNAPVDPHTGEFVYVPIPEGRKSRFHKGLARRFDEVVPAIQDFSRRRGLDPEGQLRWLAKVDRRPMHLDPDYEYLTYGDDGDARGSQIRELKCGDLLVFYAGLRPIFPVSERLIYALVGLFVVDEVLPVSNVARSRWEENAHTRKRTRGAHHIVVRAKPRVSGRLARCISIGEFRAGAYRVRRELLKSWGGLSVRDGFIQRSGRPPRFLDADRFYRWFLQKTPKLIASNFSSESRAITRRGEIPHTSPQRIDIGGAVRKKDRIDLDGERVVIVLLRQPRRSHRNEMRTDPFYEFGSFGCTKCHSRNLMNPKKIEELEGIRLAFAQGGRGEFRLVLLTPPIRVVRHQDRCELRWKPSKPFRFDAAPILISNSERFQFPLLFKYVREVDRSSHCGQFASRFRSRRKPLDADVAAEIIEVVQTRLSNARRSAFAKSYFETMQCPPPRIDRHRKETYSGLLRAAGRMLRRHRSC